MRPHSFIHKGYTYVPLRFISEAADRRVTWKEESQTAMIAPKDTADTLYYDNGIMKYKGDLVDGKRHGFGTSWSDNGRLDYVGEWKDDKRHGKGKMYYYFSDDLFFEGTWADGKQVEGTEYYPGGGLRYQGTYDERGLHDTGIVVNVFNDGSVLVGEMKNGQLVQGIMYYPNGNVEFEGTYKNGYKSYGKLYDESVNLIYEGESKTVQRPTLDNNFKT